MNLQQFVQYAQGNGGGSYNMLTGNINPDSGYMVSMRGYEEIMALLSEANANYYIEKHVDRLRMDASGTVYFVVWLNSNGEWAYDVSVNIPDLETAIAFGNANKQIAIWDCANWKEIGLNENVPTYIISGGEPIIEPIIMHDIDVKPTMPEQVTPIMVQHGETTFKFMPTAPEYKEECGSFEYEYSESEGMVKVWDISHPVSKECVYRMQVAPRFAKPDDSEQKYEVTFHRLYITTIDVTASSEAEAQILAHKRLYEQELEQMNVDLQDVYVKKV